MDGTSTIDVGGLLVPDAGPVFLGALAVHVVAGLVAIGSGAIACTARKQRGRHPTAGRVYWYALAVVFATASVLAAVRWRQDAHLAAIAAVAFGSATAGRWVRRRLPPSRITWHAWAMAGSYIALFTGFYVDNGPQLPGWDRLPHVTYWVLPAAVGVPLCRWALARQHAVATRPADGTGRPDRLTGPADRTG